MYEDFISLLGGPVNAFLPPGAPAWTLNFNDQMGEGVGKFTIAPGAQLGQTNSGTLRVQVEAFNQDPAICGGACVTQTLQFDVPYSVTVREPATEAIPEPATVLLTGGALVAVGLLRRRRS
jgi:hypothetical protein